MLFWVQRCCRDGNKDLKPPLPFCFDLARLSRNRQHHHIRLPTSALRSPSSRWRYPAKPLAHTHSYTLDVQTSRSQSPTTFLASNHSTSSHNTAPARRPDILHNGLRRLCFDMRKDSSSTMSSGRTGIPNHGRTQRADELLRTIHRIGEHDHLPRRDWLRAYPRLNNAGCHDNTRAE